MRLLIIFSIFLFTPILGTAQTTLYVDASNIAGPHNGTQLEPYQHIQDGINYASDGDTVLVLPGAYFENVVFEAKSIVVRSDADGDEATLDLSAATTRIDGLNNFGCLVEFSNGAGFDQVLKGFSLINGKGFKISKRYGGAIYCYNSSPTIANNIITNNTTDYGGAIICRNASAPTITNNIITGNTSQNTGGGVSIHQSTATIAGNIIVNNSIDPLSATGSKGGGIYIVQATSPVIITNNTIVGNSAIIEGGGIFCDSTGHCTINNTILWDNDVVSGVGPELSIYYLAVVNIDYSDVDGGLSSVYVDPSATLNWGAAMLDADPLFENAASGDYHLTAGSPCINSGNDFAPGLPETDFEGDLLLSSGTVDIGADESGDTDGDGLSDGAEIELGTDPFDPDSDDDGLLDGTEVLDCLTDPLDEDTDDDGLLDGEEVDLGTDPLSPDSDNDGIPDNIDPLPLDPEGTMEYLEEESRETADGILELDLELFVGPNNNASKGRRNSLSNRANKAANLIAQEDYQGAIDSLTSLLMKIDGEFPPPDWMGDSPEKTALYDEVSQIIEILEYLL